jgi:hypothetical protein
LYLKKMIMHHSLPISDWPDGPHSLPLVSF